MNWKHEDTIMLTSGVFQVKLVKKNLDLGLTVAYPRYCRTDNYPYISEVKKGSISYRFVLILFIPFDRFMLFCYNDFDDGDDF